MMRWAKWEFGALALSFALACPVAAQEAPAPHRSPRTPVSREVLVQGKSALPPSRTLEGQATILDTERLKLGEYEVRLFGVVPPQLSASFGPQTRATLDQLAGAGQVSCTIRDRDHEGRLLANCRAASGADFALELLKRGLAASARGTLRGTDLASAYLAAEQGAQSQRLGLWSMVAPAPVSEAKIREVAAAQQAAAQQAAAQQAAQQQAEAAAQQAAQAAAPQDATAPKPDMTPEPSALAVPATDIKTEANNPLPATKPVTLTTPRPDLLKALTPSADDVQAALMSAGEPLAPVKEPSFFERYQLLLTGFLLFLTAFGVVLTHWSLRFLERRGERRQLAAALRGELMAARALAGARLARPVAEDDEKSFVWPRIRVLVFQAYVGRLGLLGSDLSRQIASIYGHASDCALYYGGAGQPGQGAPGGGKRQALQSLVAHIEEVLPKLALIEKASARSSVPAAQKALPETRAQTPVVAREPVLAPLLRAARVRGHKAALSTARGVGKGLGLTALALVRTVQILAAVLSFLKNVGMKALVPPKPPGSGTRKMASNKTAPSQTALPPKNPSPKGGVPVSTKPSAPPRLEGDVPPSLAEQSDITKPVQTSDAALESAEVAPVVSQEPAPVLEASPVLDAAPVLEPVPIVAPPQDEVKEQGEAKKTQAPKSARKAAKPQGLKKEESTQAAPAQASAAAPADAPAEKKEDARPAEEDAPEKNEDAPQLSVSEPAASAPVLSTPAAPRARIAQSILPPPPEPEKPAEAGLDLARASEALDKLSDNLSGLMGKPASTSSVQIISAADLVASDFMALPAAQAQTDAPSEAVVLDDVKILPNLPPLPAQDHAAAEVLPFWGRLKKIAAGALEPLTGPRAASAEDDTPEYFELTEEELEALAYGEGTFEEERSPSARKRAHR